MAIAIKAENISKQYRLGYVGSGSLKDDASRWWARMRGKEDPLLTIGETNDRSTKGESDYVWALKDINFEIEQGDTVGIIGRNGAGKSTLLKILSKVTAPTTGNIKVKGRIASLLEVGTGFHGELTGRENIYLNGAIMGMRKHEITRKLDEIVDFAGVERYLDTPVKRYSSGMYVRLGFAVAAHLENEILIVDEVLAVGDAEFQKKCLGKMGDVANGEGRTVLFVSHNMSSIKHICNRALVLNRGEVEYNSSTQAAIAYYQQQTYNESKELQKNKIIQLLKEKSNKIKIKSILINESDVPFLKFETADKIILKIKVVGEIIESTKVEIEGRLFDNLETPLGMFSPGHNKKSNKIYEKGMFELEENIVIPGNVHKGEYYLKLYLSNPGVEYYYISESPIVIQYDGYKTVNNNVFEYINGNGIIHFTA